ncbi:sodium:solute symporter family protein [Methanocalculus taiwanensis]|uniref:Sodium:solute symporter family protein n=1 Tax=Methanocalculus taiwanensis TaxID=106207 RepID=A0ABD4TJ17_9EURY|nr:sodium:solute symporter family protein [Methanocalculus taiwanensis]MCQ1537779.1 sodium:solute symporter family protein [Methanocalculus taiwanensis]
MAVDVLTLSIVVAIYLLLIVGIGYYGYKKTKVAEDYMVAGRNTHPVVIALSYGATFISTSAIVGFGGVAANLGMGLIWLTVLNIGVGIFIAFVFFGKKIRETGKRLSAYTFPDLMGKCYNSPFLQYISGIIIILSMPIYTAAILIGGARFIEVTLSIPYETALLGFALIVGAYVVFGGLIAVMHTDALQGAIMLIGMTALLLLTYIHLGGVVAANTALTNMAHLVPEGLAAAGHTGWTSMPTFGSPIWMTLITTMVLGVGIGVLAQPQLIVRFMTAKDDKSLHRATLIGGPFILMMTGVAFTVGALTNVYFYQQSGQIAVTAAGGNIDSIIPLFITQSMPDVFVIIFMLTLLCAAMSTLSSLYHTMGTALACDVWGRGRECALSLTANKRGIMIMMVISILVAFLLPGSIIARATVIFMGLCASAFLPAFVNGITSKSPCVIGAKASLLAGAFVWFIWTVFVHAAESSVLGLSQFIFGVPSILSQPWSACNPLVIALPVSLIVMVLFQIRHNRRMA